MAQKGGFPPRDAGLSKGHEQAILVDEIRTRRLRLG